MWSSTTASPWNALASGRVDRVVADHDDVGDYLFVIATAGAQPRQRGFERTEKVIWQAIAEGRSAAGGRR
jgi:hypothetical protein